MKTTLALLLLASSPAFAGVKFSVPEGCTAYMTVQHANCEVSQHYTCQADPKGDQWSVYIGQDGPYYQSRIDAETRWLESRDVISGATDKIGAETDAASFTTLLATGRDSYDFTTVSSTGEVLRFAGFDQLTGRKLKIDGVPLEETEFKVEAFAQDGSFMNRRTGHQLISRDHRLFFADEERFETTEGEEIESRATPMTFAFPGDKGFLAAEPQFGCNQMMTGDWPPALVPASYPQGGK